jgi:hypothetical protein
LGFDDQGKGCLLIVKRDVKNFESSAEMVDAASGAALFKIGSIPGTVEAAALSKDGGTLIMLSQRTLVLNKKTQEVDWQTQAWDLKAGGTAIHAHKLLRPVNQVALSADGQSVLLYQGGTPQALNFSAVPEMDREGEALLWRPREKKTTTLRHRLPVQHAAFSADGRLVVTASADRTARIWHVADGRSAAPALEHRDKVVHVAILGDRVVTSSLDHTARLWDLRTGELLAPPLHHAAGVLGAALSPDGLRLVTACEDGAAHVWDFSKDPPDRTGSATLLGLLTGHRLEETGGLVPMDLGQIQQAWNSVQKNLPDQVRPNPKLASVWRRGEMLQAWNAADWYASQVHLTHLMQEEPKEPRWVKMRAEARARLEEWNGAEEDFRQAIALGVEDVPTHFSCLLLQMHLGKKNDYQGAGQSLLRRVPREGNAAHSVQLLELLALKPDSVPGFDAAVALAEELVQAEGKSVEKRLALAALHVRAGQAKNALVLLEAEAKNVTIPGVRAAFFLCLAQRQLGQKEAADQWRQKAITGLAQLEEAPRYRRFWQERLALRMLRKELE